MDKNSDKSCYKSNGGVGKKLTCYGEWGKECAECELYGDYISVEREVKMCRKKNG
jgi:hypothetical protein